MGKFPHWLRPSVLRWAACEAEANEAEARRRLNVIEQGRDNTTDPELRRAYEGYVAAAETAIEIHRQYRLRWRNIATRIDNGKATP